MTTFLLTTTWLDDSIYLLSNLDERKNLICQARNLKERKPDPYSEYV